MANVSSTEAAALLRKLGKTFTVHYTDGTSRAFVQSLSNWNTSDGYDGETQALAMSYRNDAAGNPQARPTYLYQYGLALDSSRTIASITLPANTDSVILVAIDLLP